MQKTLGLDRRRFCGVQRQRSLRVRSILPRHLSFKQE